MGIPPPLELVNATLNVPELPLMRLDGPETLSFVPTTATLNEADTVPTVAVTVMERFDGSPGVLNVADASPFESLVPAELLPLVATGAIVPELALKITPAPVTTALLEFVTIAVIVTGPELSD